ncbi:uncharacterized protein LOC135848613 [Planococcus citri]|uniref:uncharacterized protein LOC135848613 n=1 Tax=Planococcus citri TaxID=170843 RepID=UPI0031F9CB6C
MDSTSPDGQSLRSLFNGHPPKLKRICSLNIALSLWKHVLFRDKVTEKVGVRLRSTTRKNKDGELVGDLNTTFFIDVKNSLDALQLPRSVAECIQKSCQQVGKEMNEWKDHMAYEILYSVNLNMFRSHLKCCSWYSNGTIDYRKSARKFVSIADIDKTQKFEIASHFSLKDVLIDLCESPDAGLLQLMKNFTKKVQFYTRPLVYYWLCTLTKQMNKLPTLRNATSVEEVMLTRSGVKYYWWSIEYFFRRLSNQNKIEIAIQLIQSNSSLREVHPKKLAVTMNENQLTTMLSSIPVDFICKLMEYRDPQLALSVWTHVKDWIDDEQFIILIEDLMKNADREDRQTRSIWLMNIWNSAYDHQKNAFLSQDKGVIIQKFFNEWYAEFSTSVLSYASAERRKELFLEHGVYLVLYARYHLDYISEVLRVHLPNPSDADLQEFIETILSRLTINFWTSKYNQTCCAEFLKLYFPKNYETLMKNSNFLPLFDRNCVSISMSRYRRRWSLT